MSLSECTNSQAGSGGEEANLATGRVIYHHGALV